MRRICRAWKSTLRTWGLFLKVRLLITWGNNMNQDNRGKVWTKEDKDQLTHLFRNGADLATIAKTMGRTPYGVVSQLVGLGILLHKDKAYYEVMHDPWELQEGVRELQKDFEQEHFTKLREAE